MKVTAFHVFAVDDNLKISYKKNCLESHFPLSELPYIFLKLKW